MGDTGLEHFTMPRSGAYERDGDSHRLPFWHRFARRNSHLTPKRSWPRLGERLRSRACHATFGSVTQPQAPAGWYPNPDGEGMRWWDGARWTEPPAPVVRVGPPKGSTTDAPPPQSPSPAAWWRLSSFTPIGKILWVVAVALLAGGLVMGYGMHVHSMGFTAVDPAHPTLDELQSTHAVDCGTAFSQQFSSVACSQQLDGHKTMATVLLILGGALGIGAWTQRVKTVA